MAVEEGYRLVDTASMYRNEEGVGKALVGRTDVFVTTKLGNSDHGFDEALRAFDESIKKLHRDTLDLYLIHWPRPRVNRYVESWKALVRLQRDGRIRSIGVSNFNRDHLERIIGETGVTPSVNQIELHPQFQQKALRAFHDQKGIKTESWSPLGRGGLLSESALVDIAAKHRKTPAQVVIRWHLDSGLIVIPKTVRLERLKENIGVLDFKLDGDDMQAHRSARFARRPDGPGSGHGDFLTLAIARSRNTRRGRLGAVKPNCAKKPRNGRFSTTNQFKDLKGPMRNVSLRVAKRGFRRLQARGRGRPALPAAQRMAGARQ